MLLKNQEEKLKLIIFLLSFTKSVLNLEELCAYTGLSKSHVYKLTMHGRIPHYKQSKHLYFDRIEIENWLKENRIKISEEVERESATLVTLNNRRTGL